MIPIEILTEPQLEARFGRAWRRGLRVFVQEAAEAARLRGGISLLLTDDRKIRRLNREFRHKDKTTDVLSFPAPSGPGNGRPRTAGDLAISMDTAARQAEEQGHALAAELRILVLHGLLHLAGLDHETDAGHMARKEASLRRRFGLTAGLIERAKTRRSGPAHNGKSLTAVRTRRTKAKTQAPAKRGSRP